MSKIIGVTVGTPISPERLRDKIGVFDFCRVAYILDNASCDRYITEVKKNTPFRVTISPNDGCKLKSIKTIMNGEIRNERNYPDGSEASFTWSENNVTGDLTVVAIAELAELPKNGVQTVNGKEPDENGNIDVAVVEGSTVYVGSGEMPEGFNVQIDPEGETPAVVYTVNGQAPDENGNVEIEVSGGNVALTADQIAALHGMFKVCAFTKADISAEYNAFKTAFGITDSGEEEPDEPVIPDEPDKPEVTLSSISAVYNGGEVPIGTAVNSLTGIVVTAHYSDGTSEPVTAYTMNGTIAEGNNTITVSYGGMTTNFAVTGVAESGGEEIGVSNETTWTSGVDYTFTPIVDEYPDKSTGVIKTYSGWQRTPYLYCAGASTLRVTTTVNTAALNGGCSDNAFYDADKKYVGTFGYYGLSSKDPGYYIDIAIPENAAYFILSGGTGRFPHDGGYFRDGQITLTPYE